jgi:hypothetical protein
MKGGFELKLFKNYNLTPAEQIKLDKFLKENLENGHPNRPWPLHFSLFLKKMANFDHVRTTGIWTVKNSYPLPLILEIMDKLKGTKYSTKLDVCWGYNNI